MEPKKATPIDVVIVGAGPAGLAAALVCGRARLKTKVFTAGGARNHVTTASHGFLTRDGVHPQDLQRIAVEQLEKYAAVEVVSLAVVAVEKNGGGFSVTDASGASHKAKRVILATGYRDDLKRLEIPGIEDVYGKTVYPCPFCDGYEHADEKLAIFMGDGASHFVPVVQVWSENVVVFTNGRPIANSELQALAAGGVMVEQGKIRRLESTAGALEAVVLDDGRRITREAGFIGDDYASPATPFAEQLGVAKTTNAWGMEVLDADAAGKTNVDGLFIVGDEKSGFGGITAAVNDGSSCAQHLVHSIAQARWGQRTASSS